MNLAEMCYEMTKAFPREEVYGMTSQIETVGKMLRALIRSVQEKAH
jgi:hypothetical protein